jgi:hypothetical protein
MAAVLNPNPILKKDEWDQDDIHMLFKDDNDPKELWVLLLSSVSAKKIQPSRVGFTRTCRYDSSLTAIDTIYFEPITLVTWAIDKKLTLSIAMQEWYGQQEKQNLCYGESANIYLYLSEQQHISDDLILLLKASDKFWKKAIPEEKDTHTKNEIVMNWLQEKGCSKVTATQGATIIRPTWAAKGSY